MLAEIKTRRGAAAHGLLAAALLCLLGCTTQPRGLMISIPPPDGWEAELRAQRQAKDEQFKTSPETPLLERDRAGFEGLHYWEADAEYYFVGPLNLYPQPERFEIVATSGTRRPCAKIGWIGFELDGQVLRLQVYQLLDGSGGYFLPFMDATTGEETYPAGRYLDLRGPQGGPFVLDFNTAYNPSCAYGAPERFQCPVTPPENRLSVRIEAGERGYVETDAAEQASG